MIFPQKWRSSLLFKSLGFLSQIKLLSFSHKEIEQCDIIRTDHKEQVLKGLKEERKTRV